MRACTVLYCLPCAPHGGDTTKLLHAKGLAVPSSPYIVFNPVMVYNDLMIRNITVHNYNKDRSQPVTIQCLYSWVGAPVDRRRQTGMINRALISVRIIVPFFCMASRPLSASHQLILAIDIV